MVREVPGELSSFWKDLQDVGTLCLGGSGCYVPRPCIELCHYGKLSSQNVLLFSLTCHHANVSIRSVPALVSSSRLRREACHVQLKPFPARPATGPLRRWDPSSPFRRLAITTMNTAHHWSHQNPADKPITIEHFEFRTSFNLYIYWITSRKQG